MNNNNEPQVERLFGRIFFPDTPNNKIEGARLSITSNSIKIEVPVHLNNYENWPIILGEFNEIDKITLVNCRGGVRSIGAGGSYSTIRASYLVKGKHFNQLSNLNFKELRLSSPALQNWVISPDSIEQINESTYKVPDHKEVAKALADDVEIIIDISYSWRSSDFDMHFKRICNVFLKSDTPKNIDSFSEIMRHLKKLILFLTNKDSEYRSYYLVDELGGEFELVNTLDALKEDRFTQGIPISYHLIGDSFSQIIQKWFKQKELYPVIDLVLEKCFNVQMSIPGFFLNVCVALESFHDKFGNDGKEKIDPIRSANRAAIISMITNSELLAWFKAESQYWNYATLKERLRNFMETLNHVKGSIFSFETEEFIKRVVKTRNDMAHSGKYDGHFSHIELFLVSKILEFTIRLEILKLVGVEINGNVKSLINEAKYSVISLAYINKYLKPIVVGGENQKEQGT